MPDVDRGGRDVDILFIGHGAERSGPPHGLLHLQRALADDGSWAFATLLANGGVHVEAFASLGPTRVVDDGWGPGRVAQQALARAGRARAATAVRTARDLRVRRRLPSASVVYVNTLSPETVRIARTVISDEHLVVVHVHELEAALRYRIPAGPLAALLGRADRVIAASGAVRDNLVAAHAVTEERIVVHHELVAPVLSLSPDSRGERRAACGIDADTFVVVGSGRLEWRKGPDLFVRIAHDLRRLRPEVPVRFVWVGGVTDGPDWWPLDHDIEHLGLRDSVLLVGEQDEPGRWFGLADVFALTSREDAYPMAVLEAATAGVPFVTFDNGGIVELAARCDAPVVDYPDTAAFAAALGELTAPELRARRGEAAREAAAAHVVEAAAPALIADLAAWRRGSS